MAKRTKDETAHRAMASYLARESVREDGWLMLGPQDFPGKQLYQLPLCCNAHTGEAVVKVRRVIEAAVLVALRANDIEASKIKRKRKESRNG